MLFSHVLVFAGVVAAGYVPPANTYTPAPTPVVPPRKNDTATGYPIIPTPGTQHPGNGTAPPFTPISTPTSTGGSGATGTGSGSSTSTAAPSGVTGAASAHGVQGSVAALLGLVAAGMIAL